MKKIIFIILSVVSFSISAQDDAVRSMINRTEIAISKAQKHMIAGQAEVLPKKKELSIAVRYQALAVEAFKSNDFSIAVCYTAKAREYTLEVLTAAGLRSLDYYIINADEKTIAEQNKCLEQSSNLKNVSTEIINDSVLLDPAKLVTEYKISLN